MARFKKGNNFPLSTPTVRRKDVKMLRTQVEPRAASISVASRKCGTDLNIFIDLVSTVGKNVDSRPINAREIAQLLEKLLQDLIDPPEMMSKCSKLKCSTNRRRVSSKCTSTFQLTSVNSQGLYQNWSKFQRFLPKLLQLTLRCVNFFLTLSGVLIDFQSPDFID